MGSHQGPDTSRCPETPQGRKTLSPAWRFPDLAMILVAVQHRARGTLDMGSWGVQQTLWGSCLQGMWGALPSSGGWEAASAALANGWVGF